MAFASVGYW